MSVTVLKKGRLVETTPDVLGPKDILAIAQALIETFGWNATPKGTYTASSDKQGYTLHDAIGEAGRRLEQTKDTAGSKGGYGQREAAEALAEKYTPVRQGKHLTSREANDQAKTADDIVKILVKARGA